MVNNSYRIIFIKAKRNRIIIKSYRKVAFFIVKVADLNAGFLVCR